MTSSGGQQHLKGLMKWWPTHEMSTFAQCDLIISFYYQGKYKLCRGNAFKSDHLSVLRHIFMLLTDCSFLIFLKALEFSSANILTRNYYSLPPPPLAFFLFWCIELELILGEFVSFDQHNVPIASKVKTYFWAWYRKRKWKIRGKANQKQQKTGVCTCIQPHSQLFVDVNVSS